MRCITSNIAAVWRHTEGCAKCSLHACHSVGSGKEAVEATGEVDQGAGVKGAGLAGEQDVSLQQRQT